MTAADLRHSLRTPLNHIIGFGEMLQEEGADAQAFVPLLECARDVVSLVRNAGDNELIQLRRDLLPKLERMSASVPAGISPDLANIRLAISRLVAFAEGRPGSIAGLMDGGLSSPAAASASPPGGKGNLLIVDDNAANRDILRRHLEKQEYQVSAARDGQECLDLLAAGMFDLVLLDVLMPVMDGFEVLKRIRENPASRETPVVMISALDETAGVVRCIQMGAEDYLTKPFDPVLLSARIGASLEKKRLRDQERRRTEELQAALDELQRTQAQLLVQDKLASLGALTAGIAHEIRNPLNFVTNFATAAAEIVREIKADCTPELLDQLEQYVMKIDEHGRRAERIVRSMLMHARGMAGNPELVDINGMLSDCLSLAYHGLRAQDQKFNVRLETDFDKSLAPVMAIPQELSRVFLNIINNACYAAYESKQTEGVVTVRSKAVGTIAEIRIGDNGTGIPADILPKIFNPFFTTKPAGSGTGLGLSISYDIIVHRHNGTLRAESEPGQGAQFIITLPRAETT